MLPSLKRKLLWSSLGGIALGAAVAFLRRPKQPLLSPIVHERIPADCKRIILWTGRFMADLSSKPCVAHDEYLLQTTSFKVWNVLDLTRAAGPSEHDGCPIYHATIIRRFEPKEESAAEVSQKVMDRFYATVAVRDPGGVSTRPNHLARGGVLELRKCLVGGASNGIETGDVHLSSDRILNYRFEYSAGTET